MRHPSFASILALFACASCSLPQLDIAPRYAQLSLDGDLGSSSGVLTANADLETIGLDSDEPAPGVRADFTVSGAHFILSSTLAEFDGTGTLDATLSLGGDTITVGTNVATDLNLGMHSAYLLWDIFPGDTVELAAGLGVTLLDFELSVLDPLASTTLDFDEVIPIPLLAANVGVNLGKIEGNILISGFSVDAGGNSGSYIDIDAALRWKLLGGQDHVRTSIIVGWREVNIELDYTDSGDSIEADFGISGPYLAFEVTL